MQQVLDCLGRMLSAGSEWPAENNMDSKHRHLDFVGIRYSIDVTHARGRQEA